jgi:hypothetical protein
LVHTGELFPEEVFADPHPPTPPRWSCSRRSGNPEPVGAENLVTSCDLHILVYEAVEPVSAERADGRPRSVAGCRLRAGADAAIGEAGVDAGWSSVGQ